MARLVSPERLYHTCTVVEVLLLRGDAVIDYTRRATAADIPPELFPNILRYVCSLDEGDFLPYRYGAVGTANCSLVSVYWAQSCRESVFRGRRIVIESRKEAVVFRELVVGRGSQRLTPIADMIAEVSLWHEMTQRTPDACSWHHIVGALAGQIAPHKFKKLYIIGRSISTNLPSFITPYRELLLRGSHLPSPRALFAILRRFSRLEVLELRNVTWDDSEDDMLAMTDVPAQSRPLDVARTKRPLLSRIIIHRCQNNALLFFQVVQFTRTNGTWPLQTLADADQTSIVRMIKGATDLCKAAAADSDSGIWLSRKPPSK